ncbi:MAG: NnrU family protein [Gammaproteobacteria bacterium]|nr:NnrU family protein [Gammaproteobacteria bacterium]
MLSLSLAVAFFVGIHLFVSGTPLRAKLVARMGEKSYMLLFSIFSFIGLIWMIMAYRSAPYIELWGQISSGRWLSSLLILIAFMFIVMGMLSRNPTAIGGESLLTKDDPARGIFRITRHPFLVGFAIWAVTHMIYNGDLGSNIFFGGFLILSIFGPYAIDKKLSVNDNWPDFVSKTSIFPFIAILDQRNELVLKELLTWRLVVAFIVYVTVFKLHIFMFGVAPVIGM